jgi:DNA-binding transcriptional LysR family regulator
MPTYGGLYAWEFEKNGRELKVRAEGQLVFNNPRPVLTAALSGLGIAYLPEDMVRAHITKKHLVRVLSDWCPPFPGYQKSQTIFGGIRPARRCLTLSGLRAVVRLWRDAARSNSQYVRFQAKRMFVLTATMGAKQC